MQSVRFKQTLITTFLLMLLFTCNAYGGNVMPTDRYSFWVFTNEADTAAPFLLGCTPEANAEDVPLSTNIKACIFDTQSAIDSGSIDMFVNGISIINNGSVQTYQDIDGSTRSYPVEIIEKTINEYVLMYDPAENFNYGENITVTISAGDSEGNYLNAYSYAFKVQNFLVGSVSSFFNTESIAVASGVQATNTGFMQDNSVIAASPDGKHVFIVWEQRNSNNTWDIYCVRSDSFGNAFEASVRVNPNAAGAEQRYPSIALDSLNNVYVSWQQQTIDNDWDIYVAKMNINETMFSSAKRIYADNNVTDQMYPSIIVGPALRSDGRSYTQEPATVYAVWLEVDGVRSSVRYTRSTSSYSDAWDAFVSNDIRIDTERTLQQCNDPIIKLDASARTFVSWRGENADGTSSIYFDRADKNITDGAERFGTDIVVSNKTAAALGPELEVSSDGNNVYVLWKELMQSQADLKFSYYRYSSGSYRLNTAQVVNADTLREDQLGEYDFSIDNRGDASVIWSEVHDGNRVITMAGAPYNAYGFSEFASILSAGAQKNPSLGMDALGGHYYVGWTDDSNGYDAIYFCRNTYIVTDEVTSQKIDNDIGGTITVTQGSIAGTSIEVPADAIDAPITITLAEAVGAPDTAAGITCVSSVIDFGPGQTFFNQPVTITLPYNEFSASGVNNEDALNVFCYNIGSLKWELVPGAVVDTAGKTVSVGVNHFSMYMVADGLEATNNTSDGGGNGGCFIATAAFGTKMAEEVIILCEFRDRHLLTNSWGTQFVKFYYRYSPRVADHIAENNGFKSVIRFLLRPLILFGKTVCR